MGESTADPLRRFEIGDEIGKGAIATVARVRDLTDGQWFAGKILHPRHRRDEGAWGRFECEAQLAARLRHRNLVAVYGIHSIDDQPVLLMELVEGPTLATHLAREGTLPEHELVRLAHGIASGLAYAHSSGVIHRDLKPANILLAPHADGPSPKIADFGMARAASFASADKRAMTVLGTPPYMAPECLEPLAVDARTDLYALGCIMVEMATGAPPYGGSTPFAMLEAHRTAPIPSLPSRYSSALGELTTKLLAKQPGDRPQSASAVAAALEQLRPNDRALVPLAPQVVSIDAVAEGRCAGCGAAVMPELRVCFACGLVQARLEPGGNTVFVTGPGKWTHKFDNERRTKLLAWLDANAAAGFDSTELRRRLPRLPFPLIVGVNHASASTLLVSLERLGIQAEVMHGGRLAHFGVRKTIAGLVFRRLSLALAVMAAPFLFFPHPVIIWFALAAALPLIVAVGGPIALAVSTREASRPAARMVGERNSILPPQLRAKVDGLYQIVDTIGERRHRESLRAVVDRAITLIKTAPADERPALDGEMAHAVNVAGVATRRMDELDQVMRSPDFDPADTQHRAMMHERDMWSSRLLDLTATLDALEARRATAHAKLAGDDSIDRLRHTVEALEEVQRQ